MDTNKIEITSKDLITTQKVYHLKIKLNDNYYFFIVTAVSINNEKEFLCAVTRGTTHYDCGLRLKTAEKKLIKKTIQLMF